MSAHRIRFIHLPPHALVALSCCLMATAARAQEKPGGSPDALYSKDEPWSTDGAFYCLENRGSGSPSPLILDGHTFAPLFSVPTSAGLYDHRWHPAKAHAREMINVNSSGSELSWVDATTGSNTRTWTLPLVVIDMDPQPPYAPYPNGWIFGLKHADMTLDPFDNDGRRTAAPAAARRA